MHPDTLIEHKPDHEPRMAYVLMTQYGPGFSHADFERVAQLSTTRMRADADETALCNPSHFWIKKVEAE